ARLEPEELAGASVRELRGEVQAAVAEQRTQRAGRRAGLDPAEKPALDVVGGAVVELRGLVADEQQPEPRVSGAPEQAGQRLFGPAARACGQVSLGAPEHERGLERAGGAVAREALELAEQAGDPELRRGGVA